MVSKKKALLGRAQRGFSEPCHFFYGDLFLSKAERRQSGNIHPSLSFS